MAYENEYRVLIKDGTDFTENLYTVHSTLVHKRLNQMASFSFVGFDLSASVKALLTEGNEILVIYNNGVTLKGLIREVNKDEEIDEWNIVGDGSEVKLFNRENQDRTEWSNTAANTIISALINGVMNAGTINTAEAISFRAEYGNLLGRCAKVAEICKYDWYTSQGAAPTYTDVFNFDSYRGQLSPAVENFKVGDDLSEITRRKDFDRIVNSLVVAGWGDGPHQLKSSFDSVTDNLTYLNGDHNSAVTTITVDDTTEFPASGNIWVGMEKISYSGKGATTFTGCVRGLAAGLKAYAHTDNLIVRDAQYTAASPEAGSSVNTHGIKQRTFPQRDITDQDTLDRLAMRLIADYKDSTENGEAWLAIDDFTSAIDLGDTLSIEERASASTTNYRLLGILYDQNRYEIKIEFGTIKEYFAGELGRIKKEMEIQNVYGAGAPNVDETLFTDNVEQNFSLKIPFKVPDNVVAVGAVFLDIDLYQFRDYSNITGNPSVTHNHSRAISNWASGDVYLSGFQGNVDIVKDSGFTPTTYGTNHNTASHTHGAAYGIQEDSTTLTSIQLELWLDGTQLTETNCAALSGVTGWSDANDWLTGYALYAGIDISNNTVISKWTPGTRYELEIRSVNAAAHRCKPVVKLEKTSFIKGLKQVTG